MKLKLLSPPAEQVVYFIAIQKILRGTLPSWKKSRGEINIFSVPIQRSLIFTPLCNFFIKNIVQGFLMYNTIFPMPCHKEYCVENNEFFAVFLFVLVKMIKTTVL